MTNTNAIDMPCATTLFAEVIDMTEEEVWELNEDDVVPPPVRSPAASLTKSKKRWLRHKRN
jgi:hypothetical protein